MNRLRSKVLWLAVAAQVGVILLATGAITASQNELINTCVTAGLQILTLVGVLNNPTDPDKF